MAAVNVAPYILARYPETSPYSLEPMPHNVVPEEKEIRYTIRFCDAMKKWQERTGRNPMRHLNGHNPYILSKQSFSEANLPFHRPHVCAPELPSATHGPPLVFLDRLDVCSDGSAYKVRREDSLFIFKAYSALDEGAFRNECNAYAHLMARNVPERGSILSCCGWVKLSSEEISSWKSLSLEMSSHQGTTPSVGLLFDFVPGMVRITSQNYVYHFAERALRALDTIHASEVIIGRVDAEHVFMATPERAIWFGFENSRCRSGVSLRRQDFLKELADGWDYFYAYLEPEWAVWGPEASEEL